MFAPVGYVPFEKLLPLFTEAADEYFTDYDTDEPKTLEQIQVSAAGANLMEVWLAARSLGELNVAICSTDGRIFKAAPLLLFHEDQIANLAFEWPVQEGTKLHRLLQEAVEQYPELPHLGRFRYLDLITCTVVASPEHLAQLRDYALRIDEDVEPQCRVVANFDGWALCVSEADVPSTVEDLFERLGARRETSGFLPASRSRGGRPELQSMAWQVYSDLFPDGHQGLAWKEVARRVSERAARPISVPTIRRAIRQNAEQN